MQFTINKHVENREKRLKQTFDEPYHVSNTMVISYSTRVSSCVIRSYLGTV